MKPLFIIFLLFATVSAKAQQHTDIHLLPEKQRDSILLRIANDQFMRICYPGYLESRDKPATIVDLGTEYYSDYLGIPIMQVNYLYNAAELSVIARVSKIARKNILEIKIRTDTGQIIGHINCWVGIGTLCGTDDDPKQAFLEKPYSYDQFKAQHLNETRSSRSGGKVTYHTFSYPEDSPEAKFHRDAKIRRDSLDKLRAAYVRDSIQRRQMGK